MIDNTIIEQARNADIIAFLEKYHGFTFKPMGGAYRCRQHQSLAVKADRLSWYWHSKSIGGFGALDYLVKVENMAFREAVEVITSTTPTAAEPRRETPPPKTLILPEEKGISLRLYDYLCMKRGIDSDIVHSLIQRKMLYEDKRGNVVFVGYDEQGAARFASLRGTYGEFRGDCSGSDKRYGFAVAACAPSERLYIFESPIDAMSHASIENILRGSDDAWERQSRLSLAGVTDAAFPKYLEMHPQTKKLVFSLDKDASGIKAAETMARKYSDKGYQTRIEPPLKKDYNDELTTLIEILRLHKKNSRADLGMRALLTGQCQPYSHFPSE